MKIILTPADRAALTGAGAWRRASFFAATRAARKWLARARAAQSATSGGAR